MLKGLMRLPFLNAVASQFLTGVPTVQEQHTFAQSILN